MVGPFGRSPPQPWGSLLTLEAVDDHDGPGSGWGKGLCLQALKMCNPYKKIKMLKFTIIKYPRILCNYITPIIISEIFKIREFLC